MKYRYGKQDFKTIERAEENCYLMTNGLGGFSSMTGGFSCARNDHALFMMCRKDEAPNHRYQMIHRLKESLYIGEEEICLSTQRFVQEEYDEKGYRYIAAFSFRDYPEWDIEVAGVHIKRSIVMDYGVNRVSIQYQMENTSGKAIRLEVTPQMEFVPKGQCLSKEQDFVFEDHKISSNGQSLYLATTGKVETFEISYQEKLFYAYDICDGRKELGTTASNHKIVFALADEENCIEEITYSEIDEKVSFEEIRNRVQNNRKQLAKVASFQKKEANALALAAEQFISYRHSTGEKTILAGYPFFEDWGRDTMISLTGCCIATRQFETAKSILITFMQYCKNGLMPNLFPEGANQPRYNTVDAALLFIIAMYEYYQASKDAEFVKVAYKTMQEVIRYYETGTEFHIGMDTDGLIHAGSGYDQVTWMDVRVGDILPTPRHGKPVEINAYWYNALCIMTYFKKELAIEDDKDYSKMAKVTQDSFRAQFWNEKENCLKDVISGTSADNQVRCNQIWAVSLPFSVLTRDQERAVVKKVYQELYTPLGLRTLSPKDSEFKPEYSGEMLKRDLSYHQGTVWVFPLGAYYLAYLKVWDYSKAAIKKVYEQLTTIEIALGEGCIGQLPEIYDGLFPVSSKGCFAQAWSVGEILRVYRILEEKVTE